MNAGDGMSLEQQTKELKVEMSKAVSGVAKNAAGLPIGPQEVGNAQRKIGELIESYKGRGNLKAAAYWENVLRNGNAGSATADK